MRTGPGIAAIALATLLCAGCESAPSPPATDDGYAGESNCADPFSDDPLCTDWDDSTARP